MASTGSSRSSAPRARLATLLWAALTASIALPLAAYASGGAGSDLAAAAAPLPLYAGTLRQSADGLELQACGSARIWRVVDASPQAALGAALAAVGFALRPQIYLEAFGRAVGGALYLERLNRAGVEMQCPDPAGPPPKWQAQGNEPFWAVRSLAQRAVLLEPGAERELPPLRLAWRPRGAPAGRATALVRDDAARATVRGALTPRLCRDTMADAVYGWQAEIRLLRPQRRVLRGCAYLIGEPLP